MLAILKLAYESGCEMDTTADNGHFEIRKFVHQSGREFDTHEIYRRRPARDHIEVLQCAHEVGCSMSSSPCEVAARAGYPAVCARERVCVG